MSDDKIPALLTAFNVFNATHGRPAEDRLFAFLASLAASGYAVVPVVATLEMRWAGRQHFIEQSGGKQFLSTANVADFWSAMLAAAAAQEDSHE